MPIGEIKNIEIDGKDFELKKQGVNTSLTIQSVFIELVMKAGVQDDPEDLTDAQMETVLMIGLRGSLLIEVQTLIQGCVFSPKITPDSWEELPLSTIPALFWQLYMFQVGTPEKKSGLAVRYRKIPDRGKRLVALLGLINIDKWRAVWQGMFSYSIVERDKYWTYDDDIDFFISCEIKNLCP